jgi:hypothetical protein
LKSSALFQQEQRMAAFQVGDRVLILKPLPEIWQRVATIQTILTNDSDESRCLYELNVDGRVWHVKGCYLELLLTQRAA